MDGVVFRIDVKCPIQNTDGIVRRKSLACRRDVISPIRDHQIILADDAMSCLRGHLKCPAAVQGQITQGKNHAVHRLFQVFRLHIRLSAVRERVCGAIRERQEDLVRIPYQNCRVLPGSDRGAGEHNLYLVVVPGIDNDLPAIQFAGDEISSRRCDRDRSAIHCHAVS